MDRSIIYLYQDMLNILIGNLSIPHNYDSEMDVDFTGNCEITQKYINIDEISRVKKFKINPWNLKAISKQNLNYVERRPM